MKEKIWILSAGKGLNRGWRQKVEFIMKKAKGEKWFSFHSSSFILHPPGVTLLEVIIVLFIIGLASGLAGIIVSKGSKGLEVRTFAREVSSVLRYSRNHAVSEKKIYCFVIDKDEAMIRLYSEDAGYKNIETVLSKSIPEELQIEIQGSDSDSSYMEFFPRGNSSGGVIEIVNEKGDAYYLTINRITGKLTVEHGE